VPRHRANVRSLAYTTIFSTTVEQLTRQTQCILVGGGPAGVVAGLLLARRGVDVTLLEMHKDFDRDFRGDTIHASTLEVLDQLGLAEQLHALPHSKMRGVTLHTPTRAIEIVNFGRLKTRYPYIMIMPQAQFLAFLSEHAQRYSTFHLHMGAQVTEILRRRDQVFGVRCAVDGVETELRAPLTVACDGRFSRVRRILKIDGAGQAPPMDVAWLRLPRRAEDGFESGAFYVGNGHMIVMFNRMDAWQLGYVFPKGDFHAVKERGIESFRRSIGALVPWLADRVDAISAWHDVHLLPVKSDRLAQWHHPGVLFIGDAAHVMSPVFGVGINYAIADAVELVNVLGDDLSHGRAPDAALAAFQARRERPTRIIQRMQGLAQRHVVRRALAEREFDLPLIAKILLRVPGLRDVPARIVAQGLTPLKIA
jgi:2-polyprenyl-6-methoxyphenol hydroxylase-like FAD-dependent oxidoreductase